MRTWPRLVAVTSVFLSLAASCSDGGAGRGPQGRAKSAGSPLLEGMTAVGSAARAAVPAALRMAILRARQTAPGYDFAIDGAGGFLGRAGAHGAEMAVRGSGAGVAVTGASYGLSIQTSGVGRASGAPGSRDVLGMRADGQELVLGRQGVEERYLAGPLGLEQGYRVEERPAGEGPLVVRVAFEGLTPRLAPGTTDRVHLRDGEGRVRVLYSDLSAVDATGRSLDAAMKVEGGQVSLVVEDDRAVYPLRIDPLVWTQEQEVTAGDGAAFDSFGTSVALSGPLAIVGAPGHAAGAGAAYVFAQSGVTWTLQQELAASDGAADGGFGTSVALAGTVAVVGAPFHAAGSRTGAGAAYVFAQSGGTWTPLQELTATGSAAEDQFGTSVGISGSTLLVGAPFRTERGKAEAGAVYVFASNGTWSQTQELTAADGALFDLFGSALAIDGTNAVIGAYQHDVGAKVSAGAAYVFASNAGTWSQQQELVAADGATSDFFGFSVGLSGVTAIVGAYDHDVGGAISAGTAYVYAQSGGAWGLQQELTASAAATNDFFGYSVGVSGATVIVGAFQHAVGGHASQGAAYTFIQSGGAWTSGQELTASDGAAADDFGWAVAASGDSSLVGALQHTTGGSSQAGAAYVFLGNEGATDACYVGGTVYPPGAANPANPCQSCAPATSTASFSNDADGTSCGAGLVCGSGACQSGCGVGGTFYAPGAADPANACHVCTPATSTTAFSSAPDGTSCDDGVSCTSTDACTGGVCAGTAYTCTPAICQIASACDGNGGCVVTDALAGAACPDDGNPCTTDTCNAAGSCSHANAVDGTACGGGDICLQGACTPPPVDGGPSDGGSADGASLEAGLAEAGLTDGGANEDGATDAGLVDAGLPDTGAPDGSAADSGEPDGAVADGGVTEGGADGGFTETGLTEGGVADAAGTDGGRSDGGDGAVGDGATDGSRADGSASSDAEAGADAGPDGAFGVSGSDGGCSCRTAASPMAPRGATWLGAAGLVALVGMRRRRGGAKRRTERASR